MYRVETDRHPGRRIFFAPLEETISGLEVTGKFRLKPRMLQVEPDHWVRVDAGEVLYLDQDAEGTHWVTLRGRFRDLETPTLAQAIAKASRAGVFIQVNELQAVAPTRILGIRLQRRGAHLLEVEDACGEVAQLKLQPHRLAQLELCLDALDLGGGFLMSEPDDF